MRITQFGIRNFRQLKAVTINLSQKQTIFVGANNSGKTSAIQALHKFLANQGAAGGAEFDTAFKPTDIPISHWKRINEIGEEWKKASSSAERILFQDEWKDLLPFLDVVLHVNADEVQYVAHLIPTLSWQVGAIGIRLRLEPKNYEEFFSDFVGTIMVSQERIDQADEEMKKDHQSSTNASLSSDAKKVIWPTDMYDFICGSSARGNTGRAGQLGKYFAVKSYFFDINNKNSTLSQEIEILIHENESDMGANPLYGVIRIDTINAQRGFGDDEEDSDRTKLSKQLGMYHDKFLNPDNLLNWTDVEALVLHKKSELTHSEQMQKRFSRRFSELKKLNYPNLTAPNISVKAKIGTSQSLSSVEYTPSNYQNTDVPSLPEYCNGLGYQNLISTTFKLMRYRDEWLSSNRNNQIIEPLHLVLIEEPEAHLHAQVQQVFIREAYKTLRRDKVLKNNPNKLDELDERFDSLEDNPAFTTQLILSTHSGNIAHECDFNDLIYFKQVNNVSSKVPESIAVDLSKVFDASKEQNRKFVARYLQSTYYDLFFADAAIFVEGAAERMLIPHFLKNFSKGILRQRYISLLEINGSHAFRFKELINKLGITSLVVTDIDSVRKNDGDKRRKSCVVDLKDDVFTANNTLKNWIPQKNTIPELIKAKDTDKTDNLMHGGKIRVAYQLGREFPLNGIQTLVYPRTFEDALILANYEQFDSFAKSVSDSDDNIIKDIIAYINTECAEDVSKINFALLDIVRKASKGELALEILFNFAPENLTIPCYIEEGLMWLENEMERQDISLAHFIPLLTKPSEVEGA